MIFVRKQFRYEKITLANQISGRHDDNIVILGSKTYPNDWNSTAKDLVAASVRTEDLFTQCFEDG